MDATGQTEDQPRQFGDRLVAELVVLKLGEITAEKAGSTAKANMMRPINCCRLLAILAVAAIGSVLLQPMLVMHEPSSGQHDKLEEQVGGNEELDRAAAVVVKRTEATELTPPATPAQFQFFDPVFEDGVLKKQTFGSKLRVVFLAGLEGTGHHYMADVLQNMCKTAQIPCPKMCPLGNVIYPALSKPKTANDYKNAREKLREEMRNLAKQVDQLPEGKASIASFGQCRFEIGMMSYPNFNGPDKTLQYVDLKLVAEEAERAGIDLRIIYLTRAAKSILVSDTMHNDYGSTFVKEARVLMTNAAVMESYFNEIDPAFTTCFRYENITSEAQAERVSRFVSPTEYSAERLKTLMLAEVKARSNSRGHVRYRHLGPHGASGKRGSWSETRGRGQLQGGGLGGEDVEPSVAMEDWRRRQGHRSLGEELSEGQKIITERLQQKIDALDRNLCSW